MAKYVIEDTTLTGIAGAIREKNGTTNTYKPTEMAAAIAAIVSGGSGGGLNPDDYNITLINRMPRVSVSNSNSWDGTNTYYTFTNWKDYFTSTDEIELMLFRSGSASVFMYVKGLNPRYSNGYLGVTYINLNGDVKCSPATFNPNKDVTVIFDRNGMVTANNTISTPNGMYLVTRKGA